MNKYVVLYSESYIIESISRQRDLSKGRPWFVAVKVICAIGLLCLIALIAVATFQGPASNLWLGLLLALFPITFLALLGIGPRIDYWFMKRKLRRSPFHGDELQISVDEGGVEFKSAKFKTEFTWSAFTGARRVADGILISAGPTFISWWPDAALSMGLVSEVQKLVSKQVAIEGAT